VGQEQASGYSSGIAFKREFLMIEHQFRWRRSRVWLVCETEESPEGRRLVLHDVVARSAEVANGVPDWKIEYEAKCVADEQDAEYL
jgi:hypothetical protein